MFNCHVTSGLYKHLTIRNVRCIKVNLFIKKHELDGLISAYTAQCKVRCEGIALKPTAIPLCYWCMCRQTLASYVACVINIQAYARWILQHIIVYEKKIKVQPIIQTDKLHCTYIKKVQLSPLLCSVFKYLISVPYFGILIFIL